MAYDYSKLLGRIVEKVGTQGAFANAMEISERTLSLKLNNKIAFKQSEISKVCELLDICVQDIPEYFFCLKSSK